MDTTGVPIWHVFNQIELCSQERPTHILIKKGYWLMEETGYICAYTAGVLGKPHTDMQKDAIMMLYREGLIHV